MKIRTMTLQRPSRPNLNYDLLLQNHPSLSILQLKVPQTKTFSDLMHHVNLKMRSRKQIAIRVTMWWEQHLAHQVMLQEVPKSLERGTIVRMKTGSDSVPFLIP